MRRLALVLVVAGCSRAISPPAPSPAPHASTAVGLVVPRLDAAAAPAVATCSVPANVDTIDDGHGLPNETGSMELGDVQVVADDDKIAVAWTRQTRFLYGDSWRSPFFARQSGAGSWGRVELPELAYACALYGTAAVNTIERPFVSWGVVNNNSFEVFDDLPTLKNTTAYPPEHSKPAAEVTTRRQTVDHFVAVRQVSFSVLSEDACDSTCTCSDGHRTMAMWLRSLDPKRPWAQRVGATYGDADKLGAPALAMGDPGGIVAYRAKSKLLLAWLDADGKPTGAPIELDAGDVGAPAVAMAGKDAILVWARRASKDDDYQLQSLRLPHGAALVAPTPIKTAGSAFAPSIVADAKSVTLAWMEGDSGKRGEIHVAASLTGPSVVVSGDETNARDPELSGSPTHTVIVWQSFPKERMAGVIKVARTHCDAPP